MLSDLFLQHSGAAFGVAPPPVAELESWLGAALAEARAELPDIVQTDEEFALHLGRSVARLPKPATYRKLRTTDLYLASACARHDTRALAEFEQRYFPIAQRAMERLDVPQLVADDVIAELREKLFVGAPGGLPMIVDYGGRGELGAWLRSVVVHATLNALRRHDKRTSIDDEAELVEPGDPEVAYLKSLYGAEFSAALRATMPRLPDRDRTLLRQRFLDDVSSEALAKLHGVHRATIARWLDDACDRLLTGVRAELAERLSLRESELDSLIGIGRSELSITLSRLLGSG
jgi:RNA polymerase sigma-70 factor (ECF subfamily)